MAILGRAIMMFPGMLKMIRRSLLLLAVALFCLLVWAFYPRPSGELRFERTYHIAVLLKDGRVLVAGGYTSDYSTVNFDFYDYFGKFKWIPLWLFVRSGKALTSCEIFDPLSNSWTRSGDLLYPYAEGAVLLDSGKVFVSGGEGTVEIYDPTTGRWSHAPTVLSLPGLMELPGKKRLVDGGTVLYEPANVVNLQTGDWSVSNNGNRLGMPPCNSFYTQLNNNQILWTHDGTIAESSGCSLLNLSTLTWSENEKPGNELIHYRFTSLPNGNILTTPANVEGQPHTCLIYDNQSKHWRITGQPAQLTFEYAVLLLGNGQVLKCGGWQDSKISTDTEIYDPKTEKWRTSGSLNQPRYGHTATLMADGKVLAVGGEGRSVTEVGPLELRTCEIYDPATGKWTLLP